MTGQHACIVEVAVLWTVYAVVTVCQDVPVGRWGGRRGRLSDWFFPQSWFVYVVNAAHIAVLGQLL